jgi:hypothetical protein
MMSRVFSSTTRVAAAFTFLMVAATKVYAQDQCQCAAPGGESSSLASAIGGGLFAGLIAAVIPFHHAGALASAPPGAGAPAALTTMSDSTDIAPGDSTHPRQLASAVGAPGAPGSADASTAPLSAAGGGEFSRSSNGEAAAPMPSITPREAAADGMIAPKTATILPALAMLGVGAMLSGIFFLRVRRPRLRSR